MNMLARTILSVAIAALPSAAFAQAQPPAQDKPTVAGYLQQGYDIIHTDTNNGQFIFFVLKK